MATNFTPEQYKQIYASMPGPTPEQVAKYQQDLKAYNARIAGLTPDQRASLERRQANGGPQGGAGGNFGPPQPPMSQQQRAFTDWLANGGNRLGYDWNGNQTPDTGFDGFMEAATPILTAALGGAALGPLVSGAFGATSGGVAAGAIQGGITSALGAGLTGQPLTAGGVIKGAATGALGSSELVKGIKYGLTDVYGIPEMGANALTGAATGAVGAGLTGKDPLAGAISGGVGSVASGTLHDIGLPAGISSIGGKLAGGTAAGLLGGSNQGASNSGTGGKSSVPSASGGSKVPATDVHITDPTSNGLPTIPPATPSGGSGVGNFLGGLGSGLIDSLGLDPNNIGGSLGSTLGGLGPYAAVGALGLSQADKGRQQDQKYADQARALGQPLIDQSNKAIKDFNSGTLSQTDQRVVDTAAAQGKTLIDAANPLSGIASTAFQNYATGKLPAWQQKELDDKVAAQKQQVAQALQSQGITDSSILQAQYQQIDNQAMIEKGKLAESQFSLGVTAYDQWMRGTQAGQAAVLDGYKFASSELHNSLQEAFQAAQIGGADVMASIQMAMQTDAQYAEQVSSLMGTLATAYAYQQAKKSGAAGGGSGSSARPSTGGASGGGGGLPGGKVDTLDSNSVTSSADHQQLLQNDMTQLQQGWNDLGTNLNLTSAGDFSLAADALANSTTEPLTGWLTDSQLGIG